MLSIQLTSLLNLHLQYYKDKFNIDHYWALEG